VLGDNMISQADVLRITMATIGTLEWFFSRVYTDMAFQFCTSIETFRAEWTLLIFRVSLGLLWIRWSKVMT